MKSQQLDLSMMQMAHMMHVLGSSSGSGSGSCSAVENLKPCMLLISSTKIDLYTNKHLYRETVTSLHARASAEAHMMHGLNGTYLTVLTNHKRGLVNIIVLWFMCARVLSGSGS